MQFPSIEADEAFRLLRSTGSGAFAAALLTACAASTPHRPLTPGAEAPPAVNIPPTADLRAPSIAPRDEFSSLLSANESEFPVDFPRSQQPASSRAQSTPAHVLDQDHAAYQLANPISTLLNIDFDAEFDFGWGASGDEHRLLLNFNPNIPIPLTDDWHLVSRTNIAYISQGDPSGLDNRQVGFGDILETLYIATKKSEGLNWGVGAATEFPTATDDAFGTGQLSAGPAATVVYQVHRTTIGILGNHLWRLAGDSSQADVNSSYIEALANQGLGHGYSIGINIEGTHDWAEPGWTIPVNIRVKKILEPFGIPVSLQLGFVYYAEGPAGTPDWGLRAGLVFISP